MKKYLIAGLLVWMPLGITIWVLQAALGVVDSVFGWLLSASQAVLPEAARGSLEVLRHVPGVGALVLLIGLLLTGAFAANIVGQWWLRQGHALLSKIPIVKSIYNSVKQVSDTLFSSSGNAFREAVLVEYPRAGRLDDCLCHRQAERRGGRAPARRACQHLRADDTEPDLGLLSHAAAQRRDSLAHERRRSPQVRDLDGRREPGEQRRRVASGVAKLTRAQRRALLLEAPRRARTAARMAAPTHRETFERFWSDQ